MKIYMKKVKHACEDHYENDIEDEEFTKKMVIMKKTEDD